ncbi:MAG: hypothetical protein V3V53_07905 [Bacteroidales bacterium]
MKKSTHLFTCYLLLIICTMGYAQRRGNSAITNSTSLMSDSTFMGLKLRNIGPALMSGRIGDIAIHPQDDNLWYVAVGSGGVWKTTNAGTTWMPIFDEQKVYSIGCVTIDPANPHIVWVGTGENIGGRHVSYGDGIYRSEDGGLHWKNMGLKTSEHISKIIVHPDNSDIIWVAAQGPLWNKRGERGLYKSTDGGKNWKKTLGDSEWAGVTDIVIDPRNPDWLYAATWQRHRNVAAYMGGGPGTALYKSTDGGESWIKLSEGLPESNMGKIGLAISPQQPDIVYAAIEEDRRTGGIYRSADRGATWKKMSNTVSGATGPHYYQELYASPHQFERLYLMDARMQVSEDGGKTFTRVNNQHKHGDNHAIAFRKDDPDYLLIGTDGGVYESFDLAKNWRFIENLPVTQFYKVAVDDTKPFYNIYGGTQDNNTQGGPSRTDNVHGIQNSDWRIVLDWDGHQPATEPGNPDIMYAERQEGNISRIDLITGEIVDIQPQPEADENYERFNWDAPILVSPHNPKRIYFASQRVWRSDNRGDSWTAISGDLTRNQERISLSIMGKTQSWDEPWDFAAMSNYNTITSLAESPKQESLLYAGTDDGFIQVTENGGTSWQKIEVSSMPGIPATAFVNDIKADLHDVNTVYAALDNHKFGDFKPYLMKSTDKGKTWQSISSNIPDGTLVWRIVQDHVKPELIFAATEFGIYFTINGGGRWIKLKGGVPTISFRDLAIQKHENDLVGASFGRGFFVFDDYSVLREISEQQLKQEATLFSTRKAWWYVPRSHLSFDNQKGSQGASHYVAPNPPFGAVFTYYLKDGLKSREEIRKEKEKELKKQNKNITFPGWDAVEAERMEDKPKIWLTVKDSSGNTVRRIEGPVKKGFHRISWDLKYPASDAISWKTSSTEPDYEPEGLLAAPGTYTATLSKQVGGVITELSGPINFTVEQLRKGALEGTNPQDAAVFWRVYEDVIRTASAVQLTLSNALIKVKAMQKALARAKTSPGNLDTQLYQLRQDLLTLDKQFNGDRSKLQVGEKTKPTIGERLFAINRSISHSTYGPTLTNRRGLEIVEEQLTDIQSELQSNITKMSDLCKALIKAGAPWVEGDPLPPEL